MAKSSQIFWRVIRSYSIEEKVISVVLALLIVGGLVSAVVNLFKSPELFWGESGIYSEGEVSERAVVLNPLYVDFSDAGRDVSALIFSGLTRYDPGLKAFKGDLADLTISADRKTYHFALKNNLYWHDGEPVTADDVYFTFHDIIQSPDFQNPVLKKNFEGVTVKKIDERTVEFVLQSPNSFFITNLGVGIVPRHVLKDVAVSDLPFDNFNVKPVGTGSYKVDTPMEMLDDGRQRIILTASNNYYGEHPKIKNIRFNVYPDAKSMAKEKNILNVIARVPQEIVADITQSGRFTLMQYQLPQYSAIFFNMDSVVLKKEKVRLALQKSVDKSALLKLLNNKIVVDTPLLELSQSEWTNKIDIEAAKGALYDSGYAVVKDSADIYRKDSKGAVLKLVLLVRQYADGSSQADEAKVITDFFQKAWGAVGVQIDVQYADADAFNERIFQRDYDMVLTGQSLGYNYDTYSYWHSSQAGEAGLNLSDFRSFAADSLIEKIRDTFDSSLKTTMLKDLAKEISQDIPAIFLFRPSYMFATDEKVKGINLDNLAFVSDRFANVDKWCINCP
jgi:peptide/nickel transport system substrate-binding protein